jgi:hypothetical protein
MIAQSGNDPVTFSAQTNPFLRQAEGDTFNIFGKKVRKKDITKLLGDLAKTGSEEEDDEDGAPKLIGPVAKATAGSVPKYRPIDLYGGFLSMYGGQKVRGGLLGE